MKVRTYGKEGARAFIKERQTEYYMREIFTEGPREIRNRNSTGVF